MLWGPKTDLPLNFRGALWEFALQHAKYGIGLLRTLKHQLQPGDSVAAVSLFLDFSPNSRGTPLEKTGRCPSCREVGRLPSPL